MKIFSNNSTSELIANPTPIKSSTPGKVSPVPCIMPNVSIELTEHLIEELQSDHTVLSSLSQSSTRISSIDDTVSPGELLISFGEFKTSKPIQDRIRNYQKNRNSLSEGKHLLK